MLSSTIRRASFGAHVVRGRFWLPVQRAVVVTIGTIIAALGFALFQVPFDLAAGGISGIAIIINHFTGWPVGLLFLIQSVPLLVLGYYYLGRWQFLSYTLLSTIVFWLASDLFVVYLPTMLARFPMTDDVLLSSIYAGVLVGVGSGLIYRAGGSMGGTAITGRIIQLRTGMSLGQIYLYTDGIIVVVAGLIFGWEVALHSMLIIFLIGIASDFVLDGPSTIRTATIVTDLPNELLPPLMEKMQRGASFWQATGGYTGRERTIIFCALYRTQIHELKQLVGQVDPNAFVVIGNGHQAVGSNFLPLKKRSDQRKEGQERVASEERS